MSETKTQQQTIFGEPIDEQVRLETSGRIIRPFKRMVDQVAAEYKLQFTEDGLTVAVVDSANVIMITSHVQADAFETYEVNGEVTLGTHSNGLGSALRHARYGKRSDDTVTITADSRHLETEVQREIADTQATINERTELLDPDSIRATPDIPDLDLGVEVDMSPDAFVEAMKLLETGDKDEIRIGTKPDSIQFNQQGDLQSRNIELDADPSEVCEWTIFTGSYIGDIATAIQNGYVDSLTLRWDEDMPVFVDFEREGVYSGSLMVAPRLSSD